MRTKPTELEAIANVSFKNAMRFCLDYVDATQYEIAADLGVSPTHFTNAITSYAKLIPEKLDEVVVILARRGADLDRLCNLYRAGIGVIVAQARIDEYIAVDRRAVQIRVEEILDGLEEKTDELVSN